MIFQGDSTIHVPKIFRAKAWASTERPTILTKLICTKILLHLSHISEIVLSIDSVKHLSCYVIVDSSSIKCSRYIRSSNRRKAIEEQSSYELHY